MSDIANTEFLKKQYENKDNLGTRISIHDKYSTNKQGFGNWIISNYEIENGATVLELGCGTGSMWKNHMDLISKCEEIILTDFSKGMLESAKSNLENNNRITFKTVDIQDISYEDDTFDIVIANMMLYHVPDIHKGLSEVRRVLKPHGKFYCATFGENGIITYVADLLKEFNVSSEMNKVFTLQNGKDMLKKYFNNVKRLEYEDSLKVTVIDDFIDYVYSLSSMTDIANVERESMKKIFEQNMVGGVLEVPKEYGMFVCQ